MERGEYRGCGRGQPGTIQPEIRQFRIVPLISC
jgi:hypothetical protein